jgi:hypothetical protein
LNKAVFAYPDHPLLSLEFGMVYNFYQDAVRAREHFFKAKEESGLVADLSGMLGRRTKYQTFDTAQLVLLARSQSTAEKETKKAEPFKNEVKHEDTWDEGALAHANLKEEESTADMKILTEENLSLMDQCILLALCLNVKNENPRHGLTWEEMKAYVDRILMNPNNWMIHSMGLLVKARLESLRERTADRAAMQIQVLIDQFNETDQEDSKVPIRMKHIFSLAYPPKSAPPPFLLSLYCQALSFCWNDDHIFKQTRVSEPKALKIPSSPDRNLLPLYFIIHFSFAPCCCSCRPLCITLQIKLNLKLVEFI